VGLIQDPVPIRLRNQASAWGSAARRWEEAFVLAMPRDGRRVHGRSPLGTPVEELNSSGPKFPPDFSLTDLASRGGGEPSPDPGGRLLVVQSTGRWAAGVGTCLKGDVWGAGPRCKIKN